MAGYNRLYCDLFLDTTVVLIIIIAIEVAEASGSAGCDRQFFLAENLTGIDFLDLLFMRIYYFGGAVSLVQS